MARPGLCLPPCRPGGHFHTSVTRNRQALKCSVLRARDVWHDSSGRAHPVRRMTVNDEATGYCPATGTATRFRNAEFSNIDAWPALRQLIIRCGATKRHPKRKIPTCASQCGTFCQADRGRKDSRATVAEVGPISAAQFIRLHHETPRVQHGVLYLLRRSG